MKHEYRLTSAGRKHTEYKASRFVDSGQIFSLNVFCSTVLINNAGKIYIAYMKTCLESRTENYIKRKIVVLAGGHDCVCLLCTKLYCNSFIFYFENVVCFHIT